MITFNHAVNLSRQLGQMLGLTNPNMPSHRDHWGHTEDVDELRRRCRAIFEAAGRSSQWNGEDRIRLLAEYAKEHLNG
jgi:hypothetical protein